MELVVGSIGALIIVAVIIWLLVVSKTVEVDAAKDRVEETKRIEAERALERDKQMRRTRGPLRCLSCDTTFEGPLTDNGCPGCHSAALVVPEDEYKRNIGGQSS
jgi:Zn finger protein HypA/HybF involved in hydrogenase expression